MKSLLYVLAILTGFVPIIVWGYLASLKCAYNVGSANCGVRLDDFWDIEFLVIAALPWSLSVACLVMAWRR